MGGLWGMSGGGVSRHFMLARGCRMAQALGHRVPPGAVPTVTWRQGANMGLTSRSTMDP